MKQTDAQRRPITWRDLLALVILGMLPLWGVLLLFIYTNYDPSTFETLGLGIITGHLATWGGMVVIFYFRKAGDKKP